MSTECLRNVYGMSTGGSKTCGSITSLSWVYHVPITSPTMGVYHVPIGCSPHVGTRTSSAPVGDDVLPEPVGTCRWRRSAGTSRNLSVHVGDVLSGLYRHVPVT